MVCFFFPKKSKKSSRIFLKKSTVSDRTLTVDGLLRNRSLTVYSNEGVWSGTAAGQLHTGQVTKLSCIDIKIKLSCIVLNKIIAKETRKPIN